MPRFFVFILPLIFAFEAKSNESQMSIDDVVQEVGSCENLIRDYPVVKIPIIRNAVKQTLYVYMVAEAVDQDTGLAKTLEEYTGRYAQYLHDSKNKIQAYPDGKMPDAVKRLSGENEKVIKGFMGLDGVVSENEFHDLLKFVDYDNDPQAWAYGICELVSAYAGIGSFANIYKEIFDFVEYRKVEGEADDFYVNIMSCSAKASLGWRNRRSEPELWPGSRFYVVDVMMENTARESRRPSTGKLYINSGGIEYTYDTPEQLLRDGYNFGYGRVGPLLKARSKVVFIIPDKIKGEVFWSPNGSRERFWCGFIR